MAFFDDLIDGLVFGGSSASRAAQEDVGKVPGLYEPWQNAGFDALSKSQGQLDSMLNNPSEFINNIMGQYKPSDQYNFAAGQAKDAAANAAAAGGTLGTGYHQYQIADAIQGLSSRDQQQFLQNVLGVNSQALQGYGNIMNQGYNATGNIAQSYGDMAGLKQQEQQARVNGALGLFNGGLSLAGMFL